MPFDKKEGTGVLPFDKQKLHKASFILLLKCYNIHYFDNIFLEVHFLNIYFSLTFHELHTACASGLLLNNQ